MCSAFFVMTVKKLILNQEPLARDALDRGLQFGDGHFTTMKVVDGCPLYLEHHLHRLAHANDRLLLSHEHFGSLPQRLHAACRDVAQGVCKVIITRGSGGRGYRMPANANVNEYIQVSDAPPPIASVTMGVADLRLARQPRLAGLKTLNRLEQVLLSHECEGSSYDDLLVCDTDGHVIEGIQGNVFWYSEGSWHTPRLEQSGVNGVMRQVILEQKALMPLQVGDYRLSDLASVERMFLTNSVRGAVTVAQFNDKVLATQELPVTVKSLVS